MLRVNPLNHSICFTNPSKVTRSDWIGHVPFGMYIIDLLRPRTLVELGTVNGVSYLALCQAVKELGLETRCHAIGTWDRDAERGLYGPEVLADLEEHHNALYGSFSRLIQSKLDQALNSFADHSVDLLNIDGYQTYQEVKTDFEKWLPKMTERGVVLFHDIDVSEGRLGVAKFWDELKLQYPNFEFVHSNGLGVLGVGHSYPEEFNALLHCAQADAMSVRRFFSTLGARLEALQELQQVKTKLASLQLRTTDREDGVIGEDLTDSDFDQSEENHHDRDALVQQLAELKKELKNRDFKLESAAMQIRNWERRTQELAHLLGGVEDMRHTGSYKLVRALSAPLRWKYRKTLNQLLRPQKVQ